ncbi:MAG: Spy/CpxP family protein refolding chaperone [Pseudomonadota bacterium]
MNKHSTSPTGRRWIVAGLLAIAVGAAAVTGGVSAREAIGGMHGQHGPMDPAAMEKHINAMVDKVLPDGTADQKARLNAIASAALADLKPVHLQMREAHAQAAKLLMAPTVDRGALETLRAAQMTQLDAASKRILTAVEDAAEVLTPEQRQKFADHLMKRMHH